MYHLRRKPTILPSILCLNPHERLSRYTMNFTSIYISVKAILLNKRSKVFFHKARSFDFFSGNLFLTIDISKDRKRSNNLLYFLNLLYLLNQNLTFYKKKKKKRNSNLFDSSYITQRVSFLSILHFKTIDR